MKKVNRMAALIMIMIGLLLVGCDPAPVKIPASMTPSITPPPTPPPPGDYQKQMRETVDTICLDVSGVEARGYMFIKYNKIDFAAAALTANGFTVVDPGKACEATLVIQASFAGIEKSYKDAFGLGYESCYGVASAEILWRLALLDNSLPPLELAMEVTYDPDSISKCETDEEDAPLDYAWIKAVATNLKLMGFTAPVPNWTVPELDGYRPR